MHDLFNSDVHIKKKDKFNFNIKKENTIRSLSEVEFFLCSLNKALKGAKLYEILRK